MGALDASSCSNSADFAKLSNAIGKNTHLDRVCLDRAANSNVLFEGLRRNSSIKKVSLWRCISCDSGSSILTSISLTQCGCGSDLSSYLKRCTNLREITLSSCNIGDDAVVLEDLMTAISSHPDLTWLNLSKNQIDRVGCQILGTTYPIIYALSFLPTIVLTTMAPFLLSMVWSPGQVNWRSSTFMAITHFLPVYGKLSRYYCATQKVLMTYTT